MVCSSLGRKAKRMIMGVVCRIYGLTSLGGMESKKYITERNNT